MIPSFGAFTLWILLAPIGTPDVETPSIEFSSYVSRKDCEEAANDLQEIFEVKGVTHQVKCVPVGVDPLTPFP